MQSAKPPAGERTTTNAVATQPVAVIAIHGVGDQAPCETGRNLVQLLLRIKSSHEAVFARNDTANGTTADNHFGNRSDTTDGTHSSYSSFEEHSIVLPVAPIKTALGIAPPERNKPSMMSSSSEFLRTQVSATGSIATTGTNTTSSATAAAIDTDFTCSLINEYDGKKDPHGYHTLMLEGARKQANKPDQPVHVYEMYWGDLSRLGSGVLAVLGELYQLLLHAGSIARTTADMQWVAAKSSQVPAPLLALLGWFRWAIGSTIWLSTVPLVAVNFVLVAIATILIPLAIPFIANSSFVVIAGIIMAIGASVGLFFVLKIYDARRPGALFWGMAVAAFAFAIGCWRITVGDDYRATVLGVAEIIFHLLWPLALMIIALIVLAISFAVMCVALKAQARDRAASIPRSIITSVTAMVVPLSLSCVITVLLWSGSILFLKSALDAKVAYVSVMPSWVSELSLSLRINKWPPEILGEGVVNASQTAFVDYLLAHAGSETFNWMIVGMAAALALLVIGTLVSIKDELWATSPPSPGDAASSARANQRMAFGGKWLNAGLTWVALLALLVLISFGAAAMLIPIFGRCNINYDSFWCRNDIVKYLGWAFTGSSAGLLALAKAYSHGIGALRPGLDLALDVDNWLRERPKKSNPRARILSRYLALLKHLSDRGYEKVVIVAHSQGTVITADLLRLLQTVNWQHQLNIRLFTLGCPLRQLYAERFPDLYGWVTSAGGPEPDELRGVSYWLNGYRSGDYVGRALWEDLIARPRFEPGPAPQDFLSADLRAKKTFGEFSLGAGAHTHYFDFAAPEVATAIDLLIAD